MGVRSRQPSQAIVEFGLIALLFVALMFATVDFGLLLNTWQAVSSGTRDIARNASVGRPPNAASPAPSLTDEASKLTMPGVDRGFGTSCPPCASTSFLWLDVQYFDNCLPGPGCPAIPPALIFVKYGGVCGPPTNCHPVSDDFLKITLVARGAQVITPLLRPIFGCINGNNPSCHVPVTSEAIMRFEGQEFP